jgi:hypothetical protein
MLAGEPPRLIFLFGRSADGDGFNWHQISLDPPMRQQATQHGIVHERCLLAEIARIGLNNSMWYKSNPDTSRRRRCQVPNVNTTGARGSGLAEFAYRIGVLLGLALLLSTSAHGTPSGGGSRPFTALHVYYISPTGNDRHAGTSPSAPWATPSHALHCGDVIIAEAGNYGGWQSGQWGTVSNCPSTSGGIDGTGGIHFAVILCAGPNLGACNLNGGGAEAIRIDKSNWAVEGFNGTQNTNANAGCFDAENDTAEQKYAAFINDIASTCDLDGFGASGGGGPPGSSSFDYLAAVGVVAFNAATSLQGSLCGSGISMIPGNADAGTGTHIFIDGYFGAYNTNSSGASQCTASGNPSFPHSDGEGIIFDSYGAGYTSSGFTGQVVLENAVIWRSGNACVEVFPNGNGTTGDKAQYYIFNVSCYANNQDPLAKCAGAELWLNQIYPTGTGLESVTNSLFEATVATCGGSRSGNNVFGVQIWGASSHIVPLTNPPTTIESNYIYQSAVSGQNKYVVNNSGLSPVFGAIWVFGANTTSDPGYTSPNSLFSTSPNCKSYTNVTDCMLTGYNVYNNVKPTLASAIMGYQPPGACAPDPYYPAWLKGIVYLHWNGSVITENIGLVNKPCGM